ncbi:MAG: hypothetical protein ABI409_09720, partial [Ramlibacter sp.]
AWAAASPFFAMEKPTVTMAGEESITVPAGTFTAKKAEMKDFFIKEGAEPAAMQPAQFEAFIAGEIERWKKVAKAADIKPE